MNEDAVKDILWRALKDQAFRDMLMSDMDGALQNYELSDEDKAFLKEVLDSGKVGDLAGHVATALDKRENKGFVMSGA